MLRSRAKRVLAVAGIALLLAACSESSPDASSTSSTPAEQQSTTSEPSASEEPVGPQLSVNPERLVQEEGGPIFFGEAEVPSWARSIAIHAGHLYVDGKDEVDDQWKLMSSADGLDWQPVESIESYEWSDRISVVTVVGDELVLGVRPEGTEPWDGFPSNEPEWLTYASSDGINFEHREDIGPIEQSDQRLFRELPAPPPPVEPSGRRVHRADSIGAPVTFMVQPDEDGPVWVARGDGTWAMILETAEEPRLAVSTDDYLVLREGDTWMRFDWPSQEPTIEQLIDIGYKNPIPCSAAAPGQRAVRVGEAIYDGMSYNLELVNLTQRSNDSSSPYGHSELNTATLMVSKGTSAWDVEWVYGDPFADGREFFPEWTLPPITPPVEYELELGGFYDGTIRNAETLRRHAIDATSRATEDTGGDDPTQVSEFYRQASEQTIAHIFAPEIRRFHAFDTALIPFDADETRRGELFSINRDTRFWADVSVRAATGSRQDLETQNCFTFVETIEYDPVPVEDLDSLGSSAISREAEAARNGAGVSKALITTTSEVQVDPLSGRVRSITRTHEVRVGDEWERHVTRIRNVTEELRTGDVT